MGKITIDTTVTIDSDDVIKEIDMEDFIRYHGEEDMLSEISCEKAIEHYGIHEMLSCYEKGDSEFIREYLEGRNRYDIEDIVSSIVHGITKWYAGYSLNTDSEQKLEKAFCKALNLKPADNEERTKEIESIKTALKELTLRVEALK